MREEHQKILAVSQNPDELYAAAVTLIKSTDPSDHAFLAQHLSRENLLGRLDSEKDYREGPRFLRITRIIRALQESDQQSVRAVLLALAASKDFAANWTRADLLIKALIIFRPPPEVVLQFWDRHCQPEDGFMNLTVQALAENGSKEAVALLEKKLAQAGFEDEERVWWLRTAILTHRHDIPVLMACERLLVGGLREELRPQLVEVLFDYQPEEWHGPDDGYPPPVLETAGPEARRFLIRIGEYALSKVALSETQRKVVEAQLEKLRKMR